MDQSLKAKEPMEPKQKPFSFHVVTLKGVSEVRDLCDGKVRLEIPGKPLCQDDIDVLDRLFPHTGTGIDRLLSIEALAACLR